MYSQKNIYNKQKKAIQNMGKIKNEDEWKIQTKKK